MIAIVDRVLTMYPAGYAGHLTPEVRQGAMALALFLQGREGVWAAAHSVSFDAEGAHVRLHSGDFGPDSAGLLYELQEMESLASAR